MKSPYRNSAERISDPIQLPPEQKVCPACGRDNTTRYGNNPRAIDGRLLGPYAPVMCTQRFCKYRKYGKHMHQSCSACNALWACSPRIQEYTYL